MCYPVNHQLLPPLHTEELRDIVPWTMFRHFIHSLIHSLNKVYISRHRIKVLCKTKIIRLQFGHLKAFTNQCYKHSNLHNTDQKWVIIQSQIKSALARWQREMISVLEEFGKIFAQALRVEVKLGCAKAMQNIFSKTNNLSDGIEKGKDAHA